MSRTITTKSEPRNLDFLWYLGAFLTVAVATSTLALSPLIIPLMALAAVAIWLSARMGLPTALVTAALTALGLAGFLSRIAPQADILTQAGVLLLIGTGILMIPTLRTSKLLMGATSTYLLIATVSAAVVAQQSMEFAFRGWVAVVGPVLAAIAVAGATKPTAQDDGKARRKWVLAAVLLTTLANIFVGLRQSIFGMNGGEIRSAQTNDSTYLVGDQIRLMGTFHSNQDFGAFSACIAPALLVMALRSSGKSRIWLGAISLTFYILILLSLTRTALIAAVIVGLIGAFVWGKGSIPKRFAKGTLIVAGAAGVLAAVISVLEIKRAQDAIARASSLFSLGGDISYNARLGATLPRAWGIFVENPFGLGVGSSGPVSSAYYNLAPEGAVTADNGYLAMAIQLGFIGGIAFFLMLLAAALFLGKSQSPYSLAGSAACLGIMVAMLSAGYWSLLAPTCVIAALVGLGMADHERTHEGVPQAAT